MVARADSIVAGRSRPFERLRGRRFVVWGAAIGLLALALILGVGLGTVVVAPGDTIGILAHRLLGLNVAQTWSPASEAIVMDLRLPRVLSAMIVGTGLAVAGATFQGLLRNPLADPYVLGTASRRCARGGDRHPDSGPGRRVPVRPAARAGVHRRAAGRLRRLSAQPRRQHRDHGPARSPAMPSARCWQRGSPWRCTCRARTCARSSSTCSAASMAQRGIGSWSRCRSSSSARS